jgi:uncharacterized membrane protein YkgB
MGNMRFSTQKLDDRARQSSLSIQFVELPFLVAKGFHPDVIVPKTLFMRGIVVIKDILVLCSAFIFTR